jgi:Domain of unknown function (DUF397)
MITAPRPPWRKSSYSNGQANCVEIASQPGTLAVRDSKDPEGARLAFTRDGWQAFTRRVRNGAVGR